jgi:hypothetical protein
LWAKLNALADNKTILAQFGGGGFGSILLRTSGASPNTKFGVFYGGADLSGREAITSGIWTAGVWTPIGCTWDGTTMTAYINGGNTGTASGARHANIASFWTLGARQDASAPFDGDLGEVCMFPGVVLTATQMAALAKGAPPSAVDPRALRYWDIHGNGTEYERGAQLRGGRPWVAVGAPAKASSQPPVMPSRGGAQRWVEEILDPGSSLSAWTVDSGTWAINSGVIRCTANGGGTGRLRHNTTVTEAWLSEWEAEMQILSTSVADLSRGGLIARWDGSGSGAPAVRLMWRTGSAERAELEQESVAGLAGVDFAFSLDTWYKLTLQSTPGDAELYVDDVFKCGNFVTADGTRDRVGLLAQNAIVEFRNARFRYLDPSGA